LQGDGELIAAPGALILGQWHAAQVYRLPGVGLGWDQADEKVAKGQVGVAGHARIITGKHVRQRRVLIPGRLARVAQPRDDITQRGAGL
jgi:hypothetical protein